MSGPADPWRSPDRDALDDLIREGSLILDQLAALLDREDGGVEEARRALLALSAGDLQEAVFLAALERMLDARQRERRRRRWRPWSWRPWRRWRRR
jgi:hypothetical protein